MTVKLWNFICVVTKRPFRELPQNLGKACVPWLMALSVTGQTAEECENDTYLKAWQSIPPHEPKKYLYAFLARITQHLSLNCCRERSRLKRCAFICELSEEIEACIPAPDDNACRIDDMTLSEGLEGFLRTLSEEKRNIFIRRYWYLDSIADISCRFSLSQSKVKTTLFRCRNQLRQYLEKEGYTL